MILGKWNKSVILSYIGLLFSVTGMYFFITKSINYGIICLMFAGICDLFDGTVARMCKRTKEEKQFGIELDSLIDVFNFIALPIIFLYMIGFSKLYFLPLLGIYAICAIARLAHFNTIVENNNKPVPYYHGLPVTYIALIFPIIYLLSFILSNLVFEIIIGIITILVSILYIIDIKVPKPKLKSSIFLLILAIILTICYIFFL